MKTVTLGNIAGPAFNRAGAAGQDNIPAFIGRIVAVGALAASVAAVRVNHSERASEAPPAVRLPCAYRVPIGRLPTIWDGAASARQTPYSRKVHSPRPPRRRVS